MDPSFELDDCFASTFSSAREKFLSSAKALGAQPKSYLHHATGPNGETLATDVADFGDPRAAHVLMLVSGTHGVEGYCGSGLQIAHMRSGLIAELESSVALRMVHALNPCGFAYKRRVDENNVDLNRNFIDFGSKPSPNTDYDKLHHLLMTPPTLGGRVRRKLMLSYYILSGGMRALQTAVTRGQYEHPDGLFYGGNSPSWSRNTWTSILQDCGSSQRVMIIDYHTGLGKRGAGELISPLDDDQNSWRARATNTCFGPGAVKNLRERRNELKGFRLRRDSSDSVSAEVIGDLLSYSFLRKDLQLAGVYLELGTFPVLSVLDALIDVNWTYHNLSMDETRVQRERLLQVFTPDNAEWRRAVWNKAFATTKSAIEGSHRLALARRKLLSRSFISVVW